MEKRISLELVDGMGRLYGGWDKRYWNRIGIPNEFGKELSVSAAYWSWTIGYLRWIVEFRR